MFIFRRNDDYAYLLLYADDIVLTTLFTTLKHKLINALKREFEMGDLGPLTYFLGIPVKRSSTGMFLSQQKYVEFILKRAKWKLAIP